jgi:uncharacterized protein (TIGR03067 family)
MNLRAMLIVAASLLLAADAPNVDPSNMEKNKLQGTWKLVAVEFNGQCLTMNDIKDSRLTVKGDDYVFTLNKTKWELTFKIDPSKYPKEIDLMDVTGADKGKTFRGIYVVEGDTYKICRYIQPERERPTQFGTRPDSGLVMVTWQREKP